MMLSKFRTALLIGMVALFIASCNMTRPMDIPHLVPTNPVNINEPLRDQASFALSKVLANIKRGTTIAHFPAGGVEGVDGYMCNSKLPNNSTLEWGAGSSVLGNWSTELGEIFYEVLSQQGLNIAGDPGDLFSNREAVSSAEYLIGARITEIKSNICQPMDFWTGYMLDEYSGETYIGVEWTVFSILLQREVLRFTTQGYFKQKQPKRQGIILAFQNAFAHAAENLTASADFVDIALRKSATAEAEDVGSRILIYDVALKKKLATDNLENILPAVVTIRRGLGHGTGFVIAENGLILTNAHVVGVSNFVSVILNNGIEIKGEILRKSDQRDVALVKVPIRVPSALAIRDTEVKPLEKVFVIGTPMEEGLKSTVTAGIVSALRQDERTDLDFIQADAAVSPGNSGGPLLDEGGNVIGISVLKIVGQSSESLNLFIPIHSALKALNIAKVEN